jgi:gliding motility-associated-like protein
MIRNLVILLLLSLIPISMGATHNRAGEISFEQTGPLTLKVTLTTYTKTSSVAADRDSIEIFWGDGSSEFAVRANGWGDPQPNDVKINYYIASHTYPARATYTISMYDPNRVGGILNVNYPDSESVPFYLETTFTFLNTQFQGENNSAVLLQAPIDFGCVGEVFIHNPNAFDIDGDSLRYRLIIPLQGENSIVPDYVYPDEIAPGSNNQLTLNPNTGDLIWNAPQVAGEYNVAILIEEYREGVLINQIIRDMQIFILDDCNNEPPLLELIEETCVFAGDTVKVEVEVNDPDIGQKVRVEASGAPFISTLNKATLNGGFEFKEPRFKAIFEWVPACEDISDQYYHIIFKAMDNGISDTSGLATLQTLGIKVMAPPPENLEATVKDQHHLLTWDYPYACAFTEEEYFLGFSIWRSKTSNNIQLDSCETGLEGQDYEKIVFQTQEENGIHYIYEDMDVTPGENYCYRVVPEFARRSFDGFPYNQVAGKPSEEACIAVPKILPYIDLADVRKTSADEGEIAVEWRFFSDQLDTFLFPPPYSVELYRGLTNTDFEPIPEAKFYFDLQDEIQDTFYLDAGLNTLSEPYFYLVDFYYNDPPILLGSSESASSVFLELKPEDNSVGINLVLDVPWNNSRYELYRKEEGDYALITSFADEEHLDRGLQNGKEYCYLVRSVGVYPFEPAHSIYNFSQEACVIPRDNTAPCVPELNVENPCDTLGDEVVLEDLMNTLTWSYEGTACDSLADLSAFSLYYSTDTASTALEWLTTLNATDFTYRHAGPMGVKGCYAITAIDSSGNESAPSPIICVSNCPSYLLPNVFTPNNDGTHDTFTPRINRHVYQVDMKIYNQWGQKVFETSDPDINWDGRNLYGNNLAEGVYHYTCTLFLDSSEENTVQDKLTGFIHLIRGN